MKEPYRPAANQYKWKQGLLTQGPKRTKTMAQKRKNKRKKLTHHINKSVPKKTKKKAQNKQKKAN